MTHHCPHCDAVIEPEDSVTIVYDEDGLPVGVSVEPFDCGECGAEELLPSDLIPGHVLPQ